jgi:putative peptidoglycan lipid II flippase
MRKRLKWNFSVRKLSIPKKLWESIFIVQSGNLIAGLGTYAPFYFLSGVGVGIIASLNYAQQIIAQPVSFITNQVSAVSRIKISELYAFSEHNKINDVFKSTVNFLIFILSPISGVLFLYSHEIITVLFERGSFNETSVEQSSQLLRFLALSLPFTAVASIAGNLYFAGRLIKPGILYQITSNLLLIALMAICIKKAGYIGYPVAYLIMNIINVLVVYIFCEKKFPFIEYSKVLKYLFLIILFHAAIVIILERLKSAMDSFSDLSVLLVGGILYAGVVLLISLTMKINTEFNNFISKLSGVFFRRSSNTPTRK